MATSSLRLANVFNMSEKAVAIQTAEVNEWSFLASYLYCPF